jgi:colanic acid/amylovoran/stewartan biosynthesis glycosyltransferase WcaL/AmsK/CpsK
MDPPLRIAVFVGCFPVVSESFIVRQITGLLDLGHTVDIYAEMRPEPDEPIHPEIPTHRLLERTTYLDLPPESVPWEMPVWPITERTWLPGAATPVHNLRRVVRAVPALLKCLAIAPRLTCQVLNSSEYGFQAASLSALYRLARLSSVARRYDVLHAHFGPAGNSFRFLRELWRAPLVLSFHGYDFCTVPRRQGAGVYRKLFATADLLTVNSDYTSRQVEKLGGPASKLRLLPVGLDPDEFPFSERTLPPGEQPRIVSVGRLVEIKGHEYLIRAIGQLRREVPPVICDIVGDGPLRGKLAALVRELGLETTVNFHGALNGPDVKRLMQQSHLFVLPSVNVKGDQEGQGLVLQEAQASGLPVVATRHGALPEGMIDGQTGYLVPERDAGALAERLVFLIRHPQSWPQLGRAGRKFVLERYDIRRLNRRLVQLYAEARDHFQKAKPDAAGKNTA